MKKNQPYFPVAYILLFLTIVQSCSTQPTPYIMVAGDWIKISQVSGINRSEGVSFTINDTIYIGTGYNGAQQLNDFWCFSPQSNSWSQKTNFIGSARSSAVSFAIGETGYIGTGYDGKNMLNDFYGYNTSSDTWDSVASFAGTARYDAAAFAIDNYAYITTGYDGTYQNDLWQFNPASGSYGAWVKKANFAGNGRSAAVIFVHGTNGYLVTGANNGLACGDFWCYSSTTDQWQQLRNIYNSDTSMTYDADYTDIERQNAVAFVITDSAYLAAGANITGPLNSSWVYDFLNDQWIRRAPLPVNLQGAVSFVSNGYGYIVTGKSNQSSSGFLNTLIKFDPDKLYNPADY